MRFGYTIIFVPDIHKALTFYEEAFEFKTKFIAESGLYGELDTGSTTLSFCAEEHVLRERLPFNPIKQDQLPPAIEIAFTTEDVESGFKKAVEAGALPVKKPHQTSWGQQVACVRDLNGVLVELSTPIKA
jgi:uncharacterized glyoxalase superfamily protein PhnB